MLRRKLRLFCKRHQRRGRRWKSPFKRRKPQSYQLYRIFSILITSYGRKNSWCRKRSHFRSFQRKRSLRTQPRWTWCSFTPLNKLCLHSWPRKRTKNALFQTSQIRSLSSFTLDLVILSFGYIFRCCSWRKTQI